MLEEKARDLGRLIGQSGEYQTVKRTTEALNGDKGAETLLQRMQQIRQDAQRMIDKGQQPSPAMETELDELLSKVQRNQTYQRAISARENFDKLMLQVDSWIMDG